jgi:hypothetical protein
MHPSLRLFWAGLSVLALGLAGCDGGPLPEKDGGIGGTGGRTSETDGAAGGSKMDGATGGATTDGGVTDGGGIDLVGVPPPQTLTATVSDRRATTFKLLWKAPTISGATVTGYQVRYAKVPITTANFDDTTVTTAVPFTGTMNAQGTVGMSVNLYIENEYYFAVEGADSAGNRSPIDATSTAVGAHFNVTTISSTAGTNEEFGYAVDGSGDLNGDGLSDIVVGTFNSGKAYLFFGSATFAASAPAVTLSGASTGFGTGVAQIGDIDNDGKEDFAVADFSGNGVVYIYKGRATWPLTLTDAQADYVISGDATYNASNFGLSMARLGDFNGDGIDDFAIGAANYNEVVARGGRVIIVLGHSGFSSVALPSTSGTIVIDGDAALARPYFGYRVVGLGHFYSVTSGGTLVVSSPGGTTGTTNSEGRIYAFHGQAGSGGAIPVASADEVVVGPGAPARIGLALSNLGPTSGSLPNLEVGNPSDTITVPGTTGTILVGLGTTTTGPLGSSKTFTQSGAAGAGEVVFGGGVSGRNESFSILGSSLPDLGAVSIHGTTVDILDGAVVAGLSATADLDSVATAKVPLPSGWPGVSEAGGGLIPDINNDGYPDFVISGAFGTVPGAVAVFW